MIKFLFGLFVISRIIKMFKLLRGKDISNVDEIIEKVEHMYKFSDIDTSINCRINCYCYNISNN